MLSELSLKIAKQGLQHKL